MDESWGRVEALREKVAALGFRPDDLAAAAAERARLQAAAEAANLRAQGSKVAATQARERAQAELRRLAEALEQHERLAELGEEARHLARLAELLNNFRNTMVASVGPRLSAQAAELFAELTDREYDRLDVDPNTYEIKVVDAGRTYGMGRFSGSETDLANLALRVAVSEHVRFQSGGAVGLLVLDEVFGLGPLDPLLQDPTVQAFIGTQAYLDHKTRRFPKADNSVIAENEAFVLSDPDVRRKLQSAYAASGALYFRGQPDFDDVLAKIADWAPRL